MKYNVLVAFLTFLIFGSCQSSKIKHVPNKNLLYFSSIYVYGADAWEKLSDVAKDKLASPDLNNKTDTIKYYNNTIYVSCLRSADGCANYAGDIVFKNDTINLQLENRSDTVCTEINVWRMIYKIKNTGNKHYIIKKDQAVINL